MREKMKNHETPETLLTQAYNSEKLRKLAVMLVLAGMIICIIPLLSPVQNALFSFVYARIARKGSAGAFESRLRPLLFLPFFGLVVFVFALCYLFSKTISAFLEDAKNARLITALAAGTGVLLLGFVSIFSYQHGAQWLNSDYSSEMVLGKLLADENTFVSRNWHYSTEIRLIYQTIFTMPLFKLIGRYENWALIRALVILLNNLLLILSYIFMARQMKIHIKWICITSLFLIMPVSTVYWDIVPFGGFYIFFIAQIFCCIGLFIRLINHADTAKKTLLINFILFTALSFALGVQGIRSLLCVHIPLLIACIYCYSKTTQKKRFPLFLGCYGFVACCIGFGINNLLHLWYRFHSFENMRLVDLYAEFFPKLGQSLVYLAGFFGLFTGSSLLSTKGLFSVIAIIGTFILFWMVIKSLRQTKIQNNTMVQSAEQQFIPVFFIVSVIFNIFVFSVLGVIVYSYFIPFMVLYIPLTAILFEHTEKTYGHLKRMAIVSGIILFIFGQGYLNFQSLSGQDRNSVRKGYIQYLLDNKLDYGIATFWNANVTTELSNGKIELAGLEQDYIVSNKFSIQWWLNPLKVHDPYFHQGESFLLLTRAEWELAQSTGRPFARLAPDYEDNGFIVIKFPSAQIIHSEVLDD
jgi:hypothetical protein